MDCDWGEWLTRGTVRVAVACYVARLWIDLASGPPELRRQRARAVWTAGCAFYLLHVAAAFHFHHHWSHAAAYGHTARQTAEVFGIDWGGGLYFNYAFTALWLGDVFAWWAAPGKHAKLPAGAYWGVQAVFAFMMFNATVVFGPPFWKWLAAAAGVLLALRAISRGIRNILAD